MSNSQKPNNDSRLFAILAYIVPVIGGIIGLAINRENPLTRAHGQQTIGVVLTMIVSMIVWALGGFIIALIPIAGPVISISLFSLVIAVYTIMVFGWIIGLIRAIQGQETEILIASRLTRRLFGTDQKPKLQPTES